MSKSDINGASFAYGINLLHMLFSMKLISAEEYRKILGICRSHYGTKYIAFA